MKELDRDSHYARRSLLDDDDWLNGSPGSLASPSDVFRPAGTVGQPLLVTVEEGARLLGVGRTTMFELFGSGEVKSIRLGRRRLIARRSLETFVDELSAR
jgi:excisionase family DNA binding protein